MNSSQLPHYINLERASNKKSLKLVIAGTVALTAAAVALVALNHKPAPQHMQFYGDAIYEEKQQAFMQFLARYGKTYVSKSDLSSRFSVFSENLDRINAHNEASGDNGYKMGVNQFSDLTIQEFQALYGTKGLNKPVENKRVGSRKNLKQSIQAQLPEEIDWHKAGKMSIPQDQGRCGSCWAFTTAATMEAGYAIRHSIAPERLSVQYLVDCDTVNQGCSGGWMLDAYNFTQTRGIVKESDYPNKYLMRKDSQCRDDASKSRIKNDDMNEEDNISVQRLKELVAAQPVGLAMYSNLNCMMGYHQGILREQDCKCSHDSASTQVNHAVTLVGYGKNTQNNQDECPEFFKIRNSWGPQWGEDGYFKLCIPKDEKSLPTGTCQILSYVQYPLFK